MVPRPHAAAAAGERLRPNACANLPTMPEGAPLNHGTRSVSDVPRLRQAAPPRMQKRIRRPCASRIDAPRRIRSARRWGSSPGCWPAERRSRWQGKHAPCGSRGRVGCLDLVRRLPPPPRRSGPRNRPDNHPGKWRDGPAPQLARRRTGRCALASRRRVIKHDESSEAASNSTTICWGCFGALNSLTFLPETVRPQFPFLRQRPPATHSPLVRAPRISRCFRGL